MRMQDCGPLFVAIFVTNSWRFGQSERLHRSRLEVDRRMTSVPVTGTNRLLPGSNRWASMMLDVESST